LAGFAAGNWFWVLVKNSSINQYLIPAGRLRLLFFPLRLCSMPGLRMKLTVKTKYTRNSLSVQCPKQGSGKRQYNLSTTNFPLFLSVYITC
jgi:hypothetical protein